MEVAKTFEEILKFNPYHDARGRFASANSYTSFTYKPGKSKAHDLAIAREKQRQAQANSALVPVSNPVHLSTTLRLGRNTMSGASYRTQSVIEASEANPGSGELVLSYAAPTKTTRRNNGNVDYEYDLSHGLYQRSNSSGISNSIGIDWNKVHTVSGQTYESQSYLKSMGFKWDANNKVYTKNPIQAPTPSNGKLVIPRGGTLPNDLSGVTRISGDTYNNRSQIKAAGFKWDPANQEWVKPGVQKSGTVLLDDEPTPKEYEAAKTFDEIIRFPVPGWENDISKGGEEKTKAFSIFKTDDDKRLVFGWASIAITADGEQLEDRQQDIIDPEDLEEAAYEYVLNFRDTGEEHISTMRKRGKLVESCVFTAEKQKAFGIPEGILPIGWWVGFKIEDDDAWERVKNGTYRMFSIEGKAERRPVEKARHGLRGCGVLIMQDGKILTGTRIERNSRGKLGGPGGHIEDGESPEEAAIREAYEEFGVVCRKLKHLGTQECGNYGKSAIFICSDFSGKPRADEKEMSDAKWLTTEEIRENDVYPPFLQSLDLLPRKVAKTFEEILKFNPYHDARGRFASAGSYTSFTTQTKDPKKQHMADMAIARLKQQAATTPPAPSKPATPPKPVKNYDHLGFADHDDAGYHQLYNGRQYYQQQKLTAKQQKAVDSYLEAYTEPGSLYSHSQNLNYQMTQGTKLTGKYKQTHDGMMSAMHNIGYNLNLTRYDHDTTVNGLLKKVGAGSNYEKMSASSLKKALVGQSMGEDKFLSCSYNDFQNAPVSSKQVFASRAVKINYKVAANTQAMMPGNGQGGNLGEIVLAPTNGKANKVGKIVDVRLTGQMVRRKGTQMYNQPRIEIDIEIS